jgi:hypothetical protein
MTVAEPEHQAREEHCSLDQGVDQRARIIDLHEPPEMDEVRSRRYVQGVVHFSAQTATADVRRTADEYLPAQHRER